MRLLLEERLEVYEDDSSTLLTVTVERYGAVSVYLSTNGYSIRRKLPTDADAVTIAEALISALTEAVEDSRGNVEGVA